MEKRVFNPHSIRTKTIRHDHYVAFVTWGIDLKETGETARNAVYFLLDKHHKILGVQLTDIPKIMKQLGYY